MKKLFIVWGVAIALALPVWPAWACVSAPSPSPGPSDGESWCDPMRDDDCVPGWMPWFPPEKPPPPSPKSKPLPPPTPSPPPSPPPVPCEDIKDRIDIRAEIILDCPEPNWPNSQWRIQQGLDYRRCYKEVGDSYELLAARDEFLQSTRDYSPNTRAWRLLADTQALIAEEGGVDPDKAEHYLKSAQVNAASQSRGNWKASLKELRDWVGEELAKEPILEAEYLPPEQPKKPKVVKPKRKAVRKGKRAKASTPEERFWKRITNPDE